MCKSAKNKQAAARNGTWRLTEKLSDRTLRTSLRPQCPREQQAADVQQCLGHQIQIQSSHLAEGNQIIPVSYIMVSGKKGAYSFFSCLEASEENHLVVSLNET